MEDIQTPIKKFSLFKFISFFLLTSAVAACSILGILFWREFNTAAPYLLPGKYVGRIDLGDLKGVTFIASKEKSSTAAVADNVSHGSGVTLSILKAGWESQRAKLTDDSLIYADLDHELKFVSLNGSSKNTDSLSGKVSDLKSGENGTWSLKKIKSAIPVQENFNTDIIPSLSLQLQYNELTTRNSTLEDIITSQKKEMEELNDFLTSDNGSQQIGENLLPQQEARLIELQADINKELLELKKLHDQYEIAQRLTSQGKFISLARESLQKESEFLNLKLHSQQPIQSEISSELIQKGEIVMQIKRDIESERERIRELLALEQDKLEY